MLSCGMISDYAIRGKIERNFMLVSHPKCHWTLWYFMYVWFFIRKPGSNSVLASHISKILMSIQCVQCKFLHVIHHMAEPSTAVPGTANFSTTEGPQPCTVCPKFTRSNTPTHGCIWYPTRRIYLRWKQFE